MAQATPYSNVAPYTGQSPDDIATQRKMAQALMMQGSDASPVGHWTQALARAVQGGVGGWQMGQARQGERDANAHIAQALAGIGQGKGDIGALAANPWTRHLGERLALEKAQVGSQKELASFRHGLEMSDPMNRARLALTQESLAHARRMNPLEFQMKEREMNSPASKLTIVPEGGTLVRTDPRTGAHAVVAEGGQKIDATTKKAIDESDDFIAQTQAAIGALNEALRLNAQAYDGALAGRRAKIMNNVPFTGGGTTGSNATTNLQNVVINQALQSLRATFGANPTEGERNLLLEVAGSVNEPAAVREATLRRHISMAQQRLKINQDKVAALRSGQYYKPGGQPAAVNEPVNLGPQQQSAPAAPVRPRAHNPQTGQIIEFDGQRWVEVR